VREARKAFSAGATEERQRKPAAADCRLLFQVIAVQQAFIASWRLTGSMEGLVNDNHR